MNDSVADESVATANQPRSAYETPPARDGGRGRATGAELLLRSLVKEGLDFVFANIGTDYAPIVEALARMRRDGMTVPELVLCQHETVALAAAHGYAAAVGRAQAVFVHADVGTINLGGALHNVMRARVPVVIIAGLSPITTRGELAGSRSSEVQYLQDVPDQTGIVRQYVKWDAELRTAENIPQMIARAFQVANSEPTGPVYVLAPREPLEAEVVDDRQHKTLPTPCPNVPTDEALEPVVEWLVAARFPIILTSYLGRDPAAVVMLRRLSDAAGVGVLDVGPFSRTNFETGHAHYLGTCPSPLLTQADLVLVVDVDVPWIPDREAVPPDCRVVHLDIDPVKATIRLADVPSDYLLQGHAGPTLARLTGMLDGRLSSRTVDERSARLRQLHVQWDERREHNGRIMAAEAALEPAAVAAAIDRLLGDEGIILSEAISNNGSMIPQYRRGGQRRLYGSGGGSLGWGGGAALGIKKAFPDEDVVWVCGDGTFVFSVPTAVFWGARRYGTPFLTVILDNAGWNAIKTSTIDQHPNGVAQQQDDFPSSFWPEADLTRVAASAGAHTWRVERADELEAALRSGLEATRQGDAAVVSVRLRQRA